MDAQNHLNESLTTHEIYEKNWQEFCRASLRLGGARDFTSWRLGRLQILKKIPDAIAILNGEQEIIWGNAQFANWFPKFQQAGERPDILCVMDSPFFLKKNEMEEGNPNPIASFLTSGKSAKSNMQLQDGRFFELEVHQWNCPGSDDLFLMLLIHDATERRELNRQLLNLHSMCESFSHADNLKEMSQEERWNFLNEGIQYMAKCLLHYEFLEMRKFIPATNTLEISAYYGIEKEAVQREIKAEPEGNGTIGFVACTKESYLCRETENDPHYLRGGETARSSLTVPILFQGELLGIISAENSQPDAFDEKDVLYTEIFAHEIALAMNMLRLLDNEKNAGVLRTVEQIHGEIALPVKTIMDQCSELYRFLSDDQLGAQHALYLICQEALQIRHIVRDIGQELPVNTVAPSREELIQSWQPIFAGKRILLVDSSDELFLQGCELFDLLKCDLDFARTGIEAQRKLEAQKGLGLEYFAILSTLRPAGFEKGTQFFIDLARFYGQKHPPIVLLQDLGHYDAEHTIVNTRNRYRAAGVAGKPFVERMLLETIHRTVQNAAVVKPRFFSLGSDYDDPWTMWASPEDAVE